MDGEHEDHYQSKKKVRESIRPQSTALYLLRAVQLGLSINDLDALTMGIVGDMQTEAANDNAEYSYKARQSDFDKF